MTGGGELVCYLVKLELERNFGGGLSIEIRDLSSVIAIVEKPESTASKSSDIQTS